jgi:acyl-CoA thioesterase I
MNQNQYLNIYLKNKIKKWLICFLSFAFLFHSCDSKNDLDNNDSDKVSVVILGSSNAYGYGASSLNSSWAELFRKDITESMYNLSFPGYTTYHFLPYDAPNYRNITPDKERNIEAAIKLSPKIIIFSITTNDIGSGYSIDEYLNNMGVMTDLCDSNKIEYIITSTLPRNPLPLEQRKALYDLNRQLEKKYLERYVEIFNLVANLETYNWQENLCIEDFIHPNDTGHMIIYKEVLKAYNKCKLRVQTNKFH